MSLIFLLDEDVPRPVAPGLRERGVDAVSIHEIARGNRSIADEVQPQFAAEQGRVIVTYNRRDFQALDARWREEGRLHAGIFWRPEQTIAR